VRIIGSYIYQNESTVKLSKLIIVFLFLSLPFYALKAQPGDSLIIHFKNGTTTSVDLHSIRKITFDTLGLGVSAHSSQPDLQLLPSFPSPSTKAVSIPFSVSSAGKVSVNIFDGRGNIVRAFRGVDAILGKNIIQWDGLDENSRAVASGEYYYEVLFKGEVNIRKALIIK